MISLKIVVDKSIDPGFLPDRHTSFDEESNSLKIVHGKPRIHRLYENCSIPLEQNTQNFKSLIVCVIAIPQGTSLQELLEYCGDPWSMLRAAYQVVDTKSPHKYTAILECLNQEAAETMFLLTNGRQVELKDGSFRAVALKAMYLKDWMEIGSQPDPGVVEGKSSEVVDAAELEGAREVELPTCPVCLDRIDPQSTGLGLPSEYSANSLNTSDSEALKPWPGSDCQACQITLSKTPKELSCQQCGKDSDLWVCLICGHVGCARYSGEHAKSHFSTTNHSYSLDLTTQRIWDYIGDRFVHRICQTEDGNTLVQFDPFNNNSDPWAFSVDGKIPKDIGDSKVRGVKLSIMTREYNILLQSELEEQRRYYEKLLSQAVAETEELKYGPEILNAEDRLEANRLKSEIADLHTEHDHFLQELRNAHETNRDYRKRNQSLLAKQKGYKEKVQHAQAKTQEFRKAAEVRKTELEQQVQDLIFYLRTQKSVRISPQRKELEDGVVLLQEREQDSFQRKRNRKKKVSHKR